VVTTATVDDTNREVSDVHEDTREQIYRIIIKIGIIRKSVKFINSFIYRFASKKLKVDFDESISIYHKILGKSFD